MTLEELERLYPRNKEVQRVMQVWTDHPERFEVIEDVLTPFGRTRTYREKKDP